jgi:hypothetical protein
MSERAEFQLTDDEMDELLSKMRREPVMYLSGGTPMFSSQQERANDAWKALGQKRGFDGMTVRSSPKGAKFFTAIKVDLS